MKLAKLLCVSAFVCIFSNLILAQAAPNLENGFKNYGSYDGSHLDTVNVMTAGGPQESSETVLTMVWQLGFVYFDLGRAAALSSLLLIVLIAISLLRRRAFAGQA